jgi:hypothetical protein
MKSAREAIDRLVADRKRAPRLSQIAALVNEHFPKGYSATVTNSWSSTDRKIPGTRLRHPGKGRRGNRLLVRRGTETVVDHDASETYRENGEALEKVARLVKHPDAMDFASRWAWWNRPKAAWQR